MKRALVLLALGVVAIGSMAYGFSGPCCEPPSEPCCYTSFWVGDPVCFKLVIPFSFFCCTSSDELITAWKIETLDGILIYEHVFADPVPAGTEFTWDQKDMSGQQVAAGFYNIVIATTKGEYKTAIKIVEKDPCCWKILRSRPCGASLCKPYIKVYKCLVPCCEPKPCTGCCFPFPCLNCCGIFSLFFGCCDDNGG